MSYSEFIDKIKPEFEKAIKFLEGELAKIRTSRASIALVEDIEINYLDNKYALKQLAAISSPQPNQIVVQPWDQSYLESIEKAISQAGLGMSLAVDKNLIRLTTPLLTEEYRNSLVKILNEKSEHVRQTLRHWRDDAWSKIQHAQREKKISEDDKFRGKDELQKLIDEYHKKIENLIDKKKKELL
jgi:ribosome recycling factor